MNYRVVTYEAHNIGGLKDVSFDLEGRHLFIVGGDNAQGKTSALNGIRMALCGKQGCDYPEVPLREGEKDGWVRIQLESDLEEAGLAVELKYSRKKSGVVEKFRVVDANGDDVPSPRTLLARLFELRAFDPLAFERMNRNEKRETLLKLVGVDLKAFQKAHKKLYSERADIGREGKKLAGKVEAMPKHKDVPEEEVSVHSLIQEKERLAAVNADNERQRERAKSLQRDLVTRREMVESLEQQVAKLQEELDGQRTKLEAAEAVAKAQDDTVKVLEDQDLSEIVAQIEAADGTNRKIRQNQAREDAEKELEASRAEYQELTDKIKANQDAQEAALQSAEWPVDGLSFDEDGVLFNGLPIEQASKSERIVVSTRIGMALNPKLKLLVSEGGGDMDRKCLEALDEIVTENGYQFILELVTRGAEDEARCAVVIEDGEVKS